MQRAQFVGWQGRYIGAADWKTVPKYWTGRGGHKSQWLYGLDDAIGMPFVIIVEGATSVWRLGSGAVALLGKSASHWQIELIEKHWRKAIIALDPDAWSAALDVRDLLARRRIGTVLLRLPDGTDPDSVGVDLFWQLAVEAAVSQSVEL